MSDHRSDIESDVHDAVQAYATSVQPGDRLGEIRRATRRRSRPSWQQPWLLTAGAALATAAVVVGAFVTTRPAAEETQTAAGVPERDVTVYEIGQVGEQQWLYPEQVATEDTGNVVADSVRALLEYEPADSGRTNAWFTCQAGGVQSIEQSAERVAVSLGQGTTTCSRQATPVGAAQLQQLAWTVRDAVGTAVPVEISEHGLEPRRTVRPDASALSPVLLDSPVRDATVASPVTVEGRGNTFEGNVQWEVQSDGEVVDSGFETAGTMGAFRPFRFRVDLPAGDYTVRAFAMSMEDGTLQAEDSVSFTVAQP
jgi:hypothetical protein